MLEYACNASVFWPIQRIINQFEKQCEKRGMESESELHELLREDTETDEFWARVQDNLRSGKIRMVFVADDIPDELRRIVEFLNRQTTPAEVVAVEIKQYVGESLKTLVPRVVGLTSTSKPEPLYAGKPWDEASFLQAIDEASDREVAMRILSWAKSRVTRIYWGRGKTEGSFVPILEHEGTKYQLFADE